MRSRGLRRETLFDNAAISKTLMLPGRKVRWGIDDLTLKLSLKLRHVVRAPRDTQTAADAFFTIHHRYAILV